MTISHTRRRTQQWVTEQSSMQGSLVVDILAEMRNEDMLMEAGISAVDPHAPWPLNEVDPLRVMDMAVTYSRFRTSLSSSASTAKTSLMRSC